MRFLRAAMAATLLAAALLLAACGIGPGEVLGGRETITSTDVDDLGQLVVLPSRPRSAAWELAAIGDSSSQPRQYRLTAVIEFAPADADRILAAAAPLEPPRSAMLRSVPDWFPAAARDELAAADRAGPVLLLGTDVSRASRAFETARMGGGFVTRIGGSSMLYLSVVAT